MKILTSCLEATLDPEYNAYETIGREAIYRETSKQFPKPCACCGKTYRTEEQFTRETKACGPAINHQSINMLAFMRNCECQSTLALTLDHAQFDAFESYALFSSMKALGEECFKKIGKEIKTSEFLSTDCGKCIGQYLNKYDLNRIIKEGKETQEDQIHLGLNLFRERYNAWINKRVEPITV